MKKVVVNGGKNGVSIDVETGDGSCKNLADTFIKEMKEAGVEIRIKSRQNRNGDDDGGIKQAIQC